MYSLRHNEAARLIATSARLGNLGATLVQAHIGRQHDSTHDPLEHLPRHFPLDGDTSSPWPDFSINQTDADGRVIRTHLFELKFGPDTRLELKEPLARAQLAPLADRITTSTGRSVDIHVLLIGVGGRIPTTTSNTISTALGMRHREAVALLQSLNVLAVQWLHKIVQTRRMLEPD
jgi:hypothetical protein